jgi:flagellar export protein FliJ
MKVDGSRFQTVIKVKQHQEKVAQLQLKRIEDAHVKEKETLERMHEEREGAVESAPKSGRAKATDLQANRAFIFTLNRQIKRQASKVAEIREKEEAKRQELTDKAKSRQMVENLDEKRKAEFARQQDRKEQNMIDEVANRTSKHR